MTRVQLAVFPAIILGILAVLLVTRAIANPQAVTSTAEIQSSSGGGNLAETGSGGADPQASPDEIYFAAPTATHTTAPQPDLSEIPVVEPVFVDQNQSFRQDGCSLNPGLGHTILQWCGLIETYSHQNNLDPGLIAALITQESNGDANAYSSSGAVGLMQVMPRDGLAQGFMCIAGPCFADRPSSDELRDPEYNIAYGTKMLAGLVQKHGSTREALKSYGPMNVGYYYADLVLGIFQSNILQ